MGSPTGINRPAGCARKHRGSPTGINRPACVLVAYALNIDRGLDILCYWCMYVNAIGDDNANVIGI
jgi:hypothetical protein